MAVILLEHGFEGPYNAGFYTVKLPGGRALKIEGRQASMISMILSGYEFRDAFHPMDAFTVGSLDAGRADVKVVSNVPGAETAAGSGAS